MTLLHTPPSYPRRRVSSTPRLFRSITDALEYWIVHFADDDEHLRSRDTQRPSFANSLAPKSERAHATLKRGRGEDRVRAAPAVSCAKVDRKTHMSIQVQRKQPGLPCAMVLQLIPCSPRRDQGLFVTVASVMRKYHRRLDTCHWGVRTTRLCRTLHAPFVKSASASTAPRPNVSDDGQRPLYFRTGWQGIGR